jgi:DNA ligase-1
LDEKKSDWWKWSGTFSNDAVLTCMRGSGRKVIYLPITLLHLWQNNGEKRVGVCQSVFWLTMIKFRQVDDFIKENTIDKFGPVRSVT